MKNFIRSIQNRIQESKDEEKIVIWVKTRLPEAQNMILKYSFVLGSLGGQVGFTVTKPPKIQGTCYCYEPQEEFIDELQMLQVVYCLLNVRYDFVLVSKALTDYPMIGNGCFEDSFIYWNGYNKEKLIHPNDGKSKCGRILRLAGKDKNSKTFDLKKVMPDYRFEDEFRLKYAMDDKPICHIRRNALTSFEKKEKPVVFVMPIFMAVGGVERNTIETMRALQDKYTFVVITMERHMSAQGSLHDQLYGLCDAIIDMRELFEFNDYLNVLDDLKSIYHPDIIWLCNNSPWLEEHCESVREIFKDANMIAQDAYDTKYGWIEYYNRPGMKKFDHYIAINEKIKKEFINTFNLPENKIDVIYSLVDDRRIRNEKDKEIDYDALCEKYGLDKSKKHFALIGRMTEQKDPLRYLELVKDANIKYDDIEFVLVGSGILDEKIDTFIKENGLVDNVKRISYVASTPELFRVLEGLVITSVYEGLAIVSIEAMSLGVPILSTDTGDLKIFIDKTDGGIIMEENSKDIDEFDKLYSNWNLYKECAMKHSNEILDFFSASNIALQYEKIFNDRKAI